MTSWSGLTLPCGQMQPSSQTLWVNSICTTVDMSGERTGYEAVSQCLTQIPRAQMTSVYWWRYRSPALSTTFGSLTAILAPHVGCCLCGVTPVVASLGELEGWWQVKEIRSVKTPKGPKLVKAPHLGCRECKCGLICWQQELTEIKLIDSPTLCS